MILACRSCGLRRPGREHTCPRCSTLAAEVVAELPPPPVEVVTRGPRRPRKRLLAEHAAKLVAGGPRRPAGASEVAPATVEPGGQEDA